MKTTDSTFESDRPRVFDDEPRWDKPEPCAKIDIILALNWYNVNATDADAATYLGVSANIARHFKTLAWSERMASRGYVVSGKSLETLAEMRARMEAMLAASAREAA
jgi:hypothetical protein